MDWFENLLETLFAWLPLGSHAPQSRTLVVGLLGVAGFVVAVMLARRRRPTPGPAPAARIDVIAGHVLAMPRPLMDGPDVSMFNLLLLAVRDHFLLLSKIPLKSLVHLRVEDEAVRRALAQSLRNVTVDFVAVHPGTRLPVKVMFVRKPGDDAMASGSQERLVESLFHRAGIDVIRLDQEAQYSVERLTNLLGLDEDV